MQQVEHLVVVFSHQQMHQIVRQIDTAAQAASSSVDTSSLKTAATLATLTGVASFTSLIAHLVRWESILEFPIMFERHLQYIEYPEIQYTFFVVVLN